MTEPPNFTLPLPKFYRYFLAGFDKLEIDEVDATVIHALDPNEIWGCHVQFPDSDNGLTKPLLWRKNIWMEDLTRRTKLREQCERERRESNIARENAQRIARQMVKSMGLEYDAVYPIALKIAKKQLDKAAETFNVKLEKP